MSDDPVTPDTAAIALPTDGWFHRARYTPLCDAMRGKLTARLDVKRIIDTASLPKPLADVTWRVVRGTRLWRIEKAAVAQELTSHFLDGIDAGKTADELLASFGDPRVAAKLIRRAKKRARPWTWKSFKGVQYVMLAVLLLYMLQWVRLLTRESSLDQGKYTDATWAKIDAIPDDQVAWPEFRRIFSEHKLTHIQVPLFRQQLVEFKKISPGANNWPEAKAYLDSHQHVMEALRNTALYPFDRKPTRDARLTDEDFQAFGLIDSFGKEMGFATNPQNATAMFLKADLIAATENRDRERVMKNVEAMLALSQQMADHIGNSWSSVSGTIADDLYVQLVNTLRSDAGNDFLTDDDLKTIAHQVAANASLYEVSLDTARMWTEIQLDRFYDAGGGMTLQGIQRSFSPLLQFRWLNRNISSNPIAQVVCTMLSAPIISLFVDDRAAAEKYLTAEHARIQIAAAGPLWELPPASDYESTWLEITHSPLGSIRHGYVYTLIPRVPIRDIKVLKARQEATLVGLSLELFRRAHGEYPNSLTELSPRYLPTPPIDHSTGKPLLFTIGENGKPIIYGRGRDGDDDGGVQAPDTRMMREPAEDGDWVLVPMVTN